MATTTLQQPASMRGYKIRLESPRFTKKLRLIYQLFVFTTGAAAIAITYFSKYNLAVGACVLLSFGLLDALLYRVFKGIVTGSIHGDYLIVTHRLTNKSKVVDIRHLRSIRSKSFLGIPATQFTYNIDGDIRRVIILGSQNKSANTTQLLRNIKKAA